MAPSNEPLLRDVRWLKAYAVASTLAFALLALTGARARSAPAELTVQRINVVDPAGITRLVIANAERFPLPKVGGKELARAVQPAGIVFYDATGSEVGGIALTDASMGRVSALAFDYPNYDAVALVTRVAPDGKDASAGLLVNSRAPPGLDISAAARVVKRRIAVQNENENAEVLLADAQGRDRIRLRVDAAGDARIEVLDASGKVVFRAPN
jgi:hypothetical protein